ncbi:hypothetical protein [Streptococcus cristatus]|uniref:Excreted peptide n=1 Tax=Streptococcus cristatus TaxID=45634 RepID=A0A139N582_STRCR|nr:hypothetical protein [Streptococcus cristatus]KXT71093.1 hypothetical protein SCRDD08_00172 [Streptococcus cristatus]
MKKIILFSIIQGFVIFIISGILAYVMKGEFFFRYLAPIFGLAAAGFRFVTSMIVKTLAPSIYQEEKQK